MSEKTTEATDEKTTEPQADDGPRNPVRLQKRSIDTTSMEWCDLLGVYSSVADAWKALEEVASEDVEYRCVRVYGNAKRLEVRKALVDA